MDLSRRNEKSNRCPRHPVDAWQEGTKNCRESTEAHLGKTEAGIEIDQERIKAEITTGLGVKATDLVANPEEIQAATTPQEIPNEEVGMETIEAMKDRSGGHRQTVGYRNPRKRWNKDDVVRGTPIGRTFLKRRLA
jgi:hypothetical protein